MLKLENCQLHVVLRKNIYALVLGALLCFSRSAFSFDVDPGDFTAFEPGTKLGLLYLQHAERNSLYSNGSKVSDRSGLDSDIGILRGVSYQNWGNQLTNLQVLVPFGHLKAQGDVSGLGSQSGIGDPILAGTIWLYNNPTKNRYFGIAQYLFVPIGEYNHNDILNLGENRWKYTLQGGYVHGITKNWSLDFTADVTVFGANDDYTAASLTLKQDPLFQAQSYLRYQATDKLALHAGLSRLWGGETEVDGLKQNDQPNQKKFMIGASYFIEPKTQLLATYGEDYSVDNGFKEGARLNFRILHFF